MAAPGWPSLRVRNRRLTFLNLHPDVLRHAALERLGLEEDGGSRVGGALSAQVLRDYDQSREESSANAHADASSESDESDTSLSQANVETRLRRKEARLREEFIFGAEWACDMYAEVDANEAYDDLDMLDQDAQDAWFDNESADGDQVVDEGVDMSEARE